MAFVGLLAFSSWAAPGAGPGMATAPTDIAGLAADAGRSNEEGPDAATWFAQLRTAPLDDLLSVASRAVRAAVVESGGLNAPAQTASDSVDSHGGVEVRTLLPGGDFDGDGLAELLLYEIERVTGIIRIGALDDDGGLLWRNDYAPRLGYHDAFPAFVADLDADGRDEVVVLSAETSLGAEQGPCPVSLVCVESRQYAGAWKMQVLDGETGAAKWQRVAPIHIEEVEAVAFGAAAGGHAVAQAIRNATLVPVLVSDADADGAPDLLVTQLDLVRLFDRTVVVAVVGAILVDQERTFYAGRFTWQAGADGGRLGEGRVGPSHAAPTAQEGGDVDGDGSHEVLIVDTTEAPTEVCAIVPNAPYTCTTQSPGAKVRLRAARAADGVAVWESEHTDPELTSAVATAPGDLNGDGHPDLLLRGDGPNTPLPHGLRYVAFSGADGAVLWSVSDADPVVRAVDVNLDGGVDLLTEGQAVDGTRIGALDGATGLELYTVSHTALLIDVTSHGRRNLADVDDDGVPDQVIVLVGRRSVSGSLITFTQVLVVGGQDGALLWRVEEPGSAGAAAVGGQVLTVSAASAQGRGWVWNLRYRDGASGAVLWTASEELHIFSTTSVGSLGGDVDGDGVHDVARIAHTGTSTSYKARVQALSGADGGAVRWSFGDALEPAVPPRRIQNDAGLGGDAPNDFASAASIAPGAHTGTLDVAWSDNNDWYRIHAGYGQTLMVSLQPGGGDFDLQIRDENNAVLASSSNPGTAVEEASVFITEETDFRIRTYVRSGDGEYALVVTLVGEVTTPPPPPPYVEVLRLNGTLVCAAAVGPLRTADLCGGPVVGGDPPFVWSIGSHLDEARIELRWNDGAPGAASALRATWFAPTGLGHVEGPSPVVSAWAPTGTESWYFEGLDAHLHVGIAADAGLAANTAFELCIVLVYAGAKAPPDACL